MEGGAASQILLCVTWHMDQPPATRHIDQPTSHTANHSVHQPNSTTISPHPEVCRPQAGASKDEGGWLDLQHADPTLAQPTFG
ncbi:hypothetical protein ATY75_04250 [Rhizobium sp. N122]|nr:hypothetical protein ATY75_04250 [Rhizobium sp. N122]